MTGAAPHFKPVQVSILCSANLRADLDLLPRFFTLLQETRQQSRAEGRTLLLLDLGQAWAAESWVCRVTENRAIYVLLDAMGYTAVRADGLDRAAIMGLQETLQVRLLHDNSFFCWQGREVILNLGRGTLPPAIDWGTPTLSVGQFEAESVESGRLTILPPATGIALSRIDVLYPEMKVTRMESVPMPPATRADPTIVAAIEFVEREARFYAERQSR